MPDKFSKEITESLNYVVLFDGTCFKYVLNNWTKCKFDEKDEDFLNIYKSLPYEIDANKFAYLKTKQILENQYLNMLEELYRKTKPKVLIPTADLKRLFNKIDEKCK